jgi:hypothetical protein
MPDSLARRLTRSYTQTNVAPPERVFPLLCPVRERDWLDGWDCEVLYSESGFAEPNCIFRTSRPGEQDTVWTVTRHEPAAGRIEFFTVTPGSRVSHIRIRLRRAADDTTHTEISYTFTTTSDHGREFLAAMTQEYFDTEMAWWEKSINHYLQTGELLRRAGAAPA